MIEESITQVLIQSGIMGIVLAWFMFRAEKRLEKLNDVEDVLIQVKSAIDNVAEILLKK